MTHIKKTFSSLWRPTWKVAINTRFVPAGWKHLLTSVIISFLLYSLLSGFSNTLTLQLSFFCKFAQLKILYPSSHLSVLTCRNVSFLWNHKYLKVDVSTFYCVASRLSALDDVIDPQRDEQIVVQRLAGGNLSRRIRGLKPPWSLDNSWATAAQKKETQIKSDSKQNMSQNVMNTETLVWCFKPQD